jgi:hypothetical protein
LVLGLLCTLALVVPACGGGGGQPAATDTEPTRTTEPPETASTIPEPGEPLSAGNKYVTTKFKPAFSFRIVEEGWQVAGAEIPDIFDIARQDPLGIVVLIFHNPQEVYDPKRAVEQIAVPEPEDWVAWYQNHPYLKTGKPTSVSIGGVHGVRFNLEASSVPENYPERCGDPCVPLWPLSDGGYVDQFLGDSSQVTIVDVGGETVIIDVTALSDKPEELYPKAQQVLDTVEWEAES